MPFPFSRLAPTLLLAPMQDITDAGFMRIVSERGAPDACISEYFRIHESYELDSKILDGILNPPGGVRVGAQFIGEDEFLIGRAAAEIARRWPQIDMLDLNLGCPAPKIYRKNVGGGLLRDAGKMESVVAAARGAWSGCFSVKMRIGFSDSSEFEPLFERVLRHSPDFVTIHARTVRQLYRGEADYRAISLAVRMAGDIPVIANGDIFSARRAKEVLDSTGCAGVMIGRHAVRNPWIFRQTREVLAGLEPFRPKLSDVREYVDALCENVRSEGVRLKHLDSRLKKFLNFVAVGVDREGKFLFRMRRARGIDELLKVCDEFLLDGGNADKLFALAPYENLCSRPNHEAAAVS